MITAPLVIPLHKPCHQCGHNVKSSQHSKHHELWQRIQQESTKHPRRGIVVESNIGGTMYRGVLYPVDKVDDVI